MLCVVYRGFLGSQDHNPLKLTGIVEADETYVLESRKGERNLDRKARRRGGKANKRGLSDEQVPILFAVDRSATTTCSVLPSVTADNVQDILEPRINNDIILVTDGNNIYPPRAKSPGIKHEALNISAGERKRGVFNISRVNNRHSLFKDFLRRYHGVSSKYLGNYLLWFERYVLLKLSPRSYLATAIMVQVYDLRTALNQKRTASTKQTALSLRRGHPQMHPCLLRQHPSARGALNQALLQQIGLDHLFQ